MAIVYPYGGNLYINQTNVCTNSCVFCIRRGNPGLGGYNLWLEEEPRAEDILKELGKEKIPGEVVFCGFGEPMVRLQRLLKVARGLKERNIRVRVNTNGHSDLIHGFNTAPSLEGLVDAINVSLNAQDGETYRRLCNPLFGDRAYPALLDFARKAKYYVPEVILSVVDYPGVDVTACRKIAEEMGAIFRLR